MEIASDCHPDFDCQASNRKCEDKTVALAATESTVSDTVTPRDVRSDGATRRLVEMP